MNTKNIILNLIGLKCPEPIMVIRKTIRKIKQHETILVLSDDPSTKRDIPYFCNFMKHQLIEHFTHVKPYRYLLKKGIV
ncbi:MAG: sulfurtransferase TusA [Buchnera aphidicola (Aphis urticata)]|uniref:Sulfur carrier protein TusA n=1 Tax=Buchnera aphidicola (Aphis urticata) TaxID=2708353 RepID=A0AAJ4GC64_9GAMM|nr:sulfurtransferase TusA [Buchnera aphidicola]QCI18406.1 sulfurtransferase TusA [Buchnera aphidicola (Aphis nasturtii)]QIQ41452.1 MAG: sulfurtransferase TusA [Buchnera aphidicola (Aphis urticata)]